MSIRLKALAEAATPGPWGWDGPVWGYDAENEAPWLIQERGSDVVITGELQCSEANAAYISAADPATVLSLIAERDALLAERDRLREALNFSCKSLCKVTSSDGSGHADIALSVLRLAGVGADEREALVDGWKANVQWRIDRAALQGEQP